MIRSNIQSRLRVLAGYFGRGFPFLLLRDYGRRQLTSLAASLVDCPLQLAILNGLKRAHSP